MEITATLDRDKMNGKPVLWLEPKTVINFKSLFGPKLLCDGLTFSTGTSCAYSCSFCYVGSMFARTPYITAMLENEGLRFDEVVIRRRDPIPIARKQIFDGKGRPRFMEDTRTIYSSPLVDVAANMELVRETIEMCRLILNNTGWTIRLLSKSNLLPKIAQSLAGETGKYELYRNRIIYGVSTGTLDDNLAKAFEEGTALVSKRIQSLRWLQDTGFRTFGMICPSLPSYGSEGYAVFADEAAKAIRVDKCEHVWAEVMNVRGDSLVRTAASLRSAGYEAEAKRMERVMSSSEEWETYARDTFSAHSMFISPEKLRFLQYVDKSNFDYWNSRKDSGAVLLGKMAHDSATV